MDVNTAVISVAVAAAGVFGIRQYCKGGQCTCKDRIDGKLVIITGGNGGIGRETAIELAKRGGRIILACRDLKRSEAAASNIRLAAGVPDNMVTVQQLNLSSFKSVREFAEKVNKGENKVDILINNAGIMYTPFGKTEDGHEQQFQVNHLSHFLLTNLLMDKLKASPAARIVNVSSLGHIWGKINFDDLNGEKSYSRKGAYEQSKLANVLFTRELAKRLKGTSVTAYSLHPGAIRTDLVRDTPGLNIPVIGDILFMLMYPFLKSIKEGAQTSINCAVDPSITNVSGKYYSDCAEKDPAPQGQDDETADKLWRVSEKLVGLSG